MRKKRFLMLCLVCLLFLSAGCKSNGEDSKTAKEVKVWDYFTGKQQELYHKLVDQYNRSQDRYQVVTEYIPFNE